MPKSSKKAAEAAAAAERAQRELEELKKRLSAETAADRVVLRALLDAEKQANGIEQAASDYAVGAEWRIAESVRDIDAQERAATRDAAAKASAEAAKLADERLAAIRADAERRRAEISARFEQQRAGYVERVFELVTGAADE